MLLVILFTLCYAPLEAKFLGCKYLECAPSQTSFFSHLHRRIYLISAWGCHGEREMLHLKQLINYECYFTHVRGQEIQKTRPRLQVKTRQKCLDNSSLSSPCCHSLRLGFVGCIAPSLLITKTDSISLSLLFSGAIHPGDLLLFYLDPNSAIIC